MISGSVNDELEAVVTVAVADVDDVYHPFEFVVDTGFNGHLALPDSVIRRLGLRFRIRSSTIQAIGTAPANFYRGAALWHRRRRRQIVVLETDGEYLLGMSMLLGSTLTVAAHPGGAVTIEDASLPPNISGTG